MGALDYRAVSVTRKRKDGRTEWIPPPNLDTGQARVNNYHHPSATSSPTNTPGTTGMTQTIPSERTLLAEVNLHTASPQLFEAIAELAAMAD